MVDKEEVYIPQTALLISDQPLIPGGDVLRSGKVVLSGSRQLSLKRSGWETLC